MYFHVLTLFPEMIMDGLNTSILGRAMEKGCIRAEAVNIRDYTLDKHQKVDDYTYGGGAGMLMQAQPVYDCVQDVMAGIWSRRQEEISAAGKKDAVRVIYVTPQGRVFDQQMAKEFAGEDELIFLCGHYEGIDERVLEEVVTDYVSIGDYVLTGGELPAMVMIDAIARLVPGVLNNDESAMTDSFGNGLLEYPQYSRPQVWRDKEVPPVLLSGNHKLIEQWRLEKSIERTKERRPDLYEKWRQKMIVANDLCKQFERTVLEEENGKKQKKKNKKEKFYAVNHVSFQVGQGEILGILGPNGAGKTTLLRMLGSLMLPTSGSVEIEDKEGNRITDTVLLKRSIGYLSGNTKLYHRLSTREMLYMLGEIYEIDKEEIVKRVEEIGKVLDMESFLDNRIEKLSTGQTQRASIARCLIHEPDIYIFDEPTLGLDILSADAIVNFMKEQKERGKTVLYSTHYLEEAQFLCDRIIMIYQGRIVREGSPAQIMEECQVNNLRDAFHKVMEEVETA